MLISTFNTQLQKKHPQAIAYIPDGFGTGKRQANQVNVVYSPNGKVYEYKGTILTIAEKLGLIPSIDYGNEGENIASQLKDNQEIIGHNGSQDTIRYYLGVGFNLDYTEAGQDEFDRPLLKFFLTEKSAWL